MISSGDLVTGARRGFMVLDVSGNDAGVLLTIEKLYILCSKVISLCASY